MGDVTGHIDPSLCVWTLAGHAKEGVLLQVLFFFFFFLGRVTVTGGYDDTTRALLSRRGARRAKLRVSLDVGVVIQ